MTTFSVLICTYNRPDMLAMALTALIDMTIEKPNQVVVVNGGDEQSDQIVQGFMGRHGIEVRLIKTTNKNLAASRNIGLACCDGEIVAMTDDDAEVFPDWVTQMKRTHAEHPEAGGVGGAVLGYESDISLLSRISDVIVFPSPTQPGYVRTIAGVNVSYKKDVVQIVGLQDETLFRGEDVDYNWRIKQLDYEIFYTPEIKVMHHHRPTFNGLINQFYMYGRAYYLVRRKWPEMYCVYPHKFKRLRDYLKAIYFVMNIFYLPIISSWRMPRLSDKLLATPLILATQIAWRIGVAWQKIFYTYKAGGTY